MPLGRERQYEHKVSCLKTQHRDLDRAGTRTPRWDSSMIIVHQRTSSPQQGTYNFPSKCGGLGIL